ncbi:Outer membrane efflux protein [Planctomycetes bacterium Pan216]|uniref:Outer membrane efflux protein n=1 Tax=Kolteria novifilia TaxID=2527975 RepID=A0A518B5N4_9BACT|nr:Outer membrane efflux protein [Planctomycetes bacterium Pan216]
MNAPFVLRFGAVLLATVCAGGCLSPPQTFVGGLPSRILSPEGIGETIEEPTPVEMPTEGATPDTAPVETVDEFPTGEPLTLDEAIATGLRLNPLLQVARADIERTLAGEKITFSSFLPLAGGTVREIVSATELQGVSGSSLPTVVDFGGAGSASFLLAEARAEWTVFRFGEAINRYRESLTQTDIARLRYKRAQQTVIFDVSLAYFRFVQSEALFIVAENTVRRARAQLQLASNLLGQGVVDRESVLRAELSLAESLQQRVRAETEKEIALAGLNRSMGVNASTSIAIVPAASLVDLPWTLKESLELAVANRPELGVAIEGIRAAGYTEAAIRARFLPKIVVAGEGFLISGENVQSEEILVGGINLDWKFYEGGRRTGRLRQQRAEIERVAALARQMADAIGFEVNESYHRIDDARQRLVLASSAVRLATENLRVVDNKFAQGDATPTDIVDAETALTRSQQQEVVARFDHYAAIAHLVFATGIDPSMLAANGMFCENGEPTSGAQGRILLVEAGTEPTSGSVGAGSDRPWDPWVEEEPSILPVGQRPIEQVTRNESGQETGDDRLR